jgi:hypothetical protein
VNETTCPCKRKVLIAEQFPVWLPRDSYFTSGRKRGASSHSPKNPAGGQAAVLLRDTYQKTRSSKMKQQLNPLQCNVRAQFAHPSRAITTKWPTWRDNLYGCAGAEVRMRLDAMPNDPTYDVIGEGYNLHRRTDPIIFSQILKSLAMCETVLNLGTGTGCYEPTTCTQAVEPSLKMIAQRPLGSAPKGMAERLPLANQSFDGSLASFTIHHWSDVSAGLCEMCRVTRKRIVLFTWDPELDSNFWLTRGSVQPPAVSRQTMVVKAGDPQPSRQRPRSA